MIFAASMYYIPIVFIYIANILIVRMKVFSREERPVKLSTLKPIAQDCNKYA
jgi:hypothetical protein